MRSSHRFPIRHQRSVGMNTRFSCPACSRRQFIFQNISTQSDTGMNTRFSCLSRLQVLQAFVVLSTAGGSVFSPYRNGGLCLALAFCPSIQILFKPQFSRHICCRGDHSLSMYHVCICCAVVRDIFCQHCLRRISSLFSGPRNQRRLQQV
jgi:hypothetical protein